MYVIKNLETGKVVGTAHNVKMAQMIARMSIGQCIITIEQMQKEPVWLFFIAYFMAGGARSVEARRITIITYPSAFVK